MTTCAACDRDVHDDEIVAVRGLRDVPAIAYVCRDDLDDVLRRWSLKPLVPTLREEMDQIFAGEEVA